MDDSSKHERAVELLQQLGLKEYEARCFTALSRRDRGTAKEISETSEVPRTRVYDAIRLLESKGLVETQHTNPQVFRAVSVEEAIDTLRREYEARFRELGESLETLDPVHPESTDVTHEVWALSGAVGIANRARNLVAEADEEVIFIVADERAFDEELGEFLRTAARDGIRVVVGAGTAAVREQVQAELPGLDVDLSGIDWLTSAGAGDDTRISRLVLVDSEAILISSVTAGHEERAVFGRGFDNGLVTIVRRLMTTGMLVDDVFPRESY